jgi:hypothetical protein
LRRATDAAALSAANQFRENQPMSNIEDSALELVVLNLPGTDTSADVDVYTCDTASTPEDEDLLCPPAGENPRKLVLVRGRTMVPLAFMPIIGFNEIQIQAEAVSEAASLDLVLVIDTSTSMAYDGPDTDPDSCNPPDPGGGYTYDPADDNCHPFKEVRDAAKALVDHVNFPYDRVALVTYDRLGRSQLTLSTCASEPTEAQQEQCVIDALNDMRVHPTITPGATPPDPSPYCPTWEDGTDTDGDGNPDVRDPRGCMPTNTAGGLELAYDILSGEGRDESVWIVILLSDGVANAAIRNGDPATDPVPPSPAGFEDWICPEDYWEDESTPDQDKPYCQDGDGSSGSRHWPADTNFDADDATRLFADYLGCLPSGSEEYCYDGGGSVIHGLGATLFTVGLGDYVSSHPDAPDPAVGAKLLRYVAAVGLDGDPGNDPCSVEPYASDPESNCGNYYFAEDSSELQGIFEALASRIFTRLTH